MCFATGSSPAPIKIEPPKLPQEILEPKIRLNSEETKKKNKTGTKSLQIPLVKNDGASGLNIPTREE